MFNITLQQSNISFIGFLIHKRLYSVLKGRSQGSSIITICHSRSDELPQHDVENVSGQSPTDDNHTKLDNKSITSTSVHIELTISFADSAYRQNMETPSSYRHRNYLRLSCRHKRQYQFYLLAICE